MVPVLFAGLFPILLPCALAQTAVEAKPAETTQTLSVSARLVVVPVTVRDAKEHLIRNLTKDDFTVLVDGKPAPIRYFDRDDDVPLTVGLLVDVSGSLRDQIDAERTASSAFLDGMLQPNRDRAFIVQFGHNADLLADVTPSIPKLQAGLEKIEADNEGRPSFSSGSNGSDPQDSNGNGSGRRSGGGRGAGTVLYDSVFLSSDEVLKKAPAAKAGASAGQARKAVILLTDGQDNGSKESLTSAIEAAQRNDVAIYAIYYKGEDRGNGGGSPGGRGGGFPGGHGGGFPGIGFPGGGGGYPGGGNGGGRGGNGGGRERVDGIKILERMADETGGRVYEVTKKMPLPDIYKQIAEELRSQYRIGFSPVNNEDGYHKVEVDTPNQKKVILQSRVGYYTGTEPTP